MLLIIFIIWSKVYLVIITDAEIYFDRLYFLCDDQI
jgi:hypothetical protein